MKTLLLLIMLGAVTLSCGCALGLKRSGYKAPAIETAKTSPPRAVPIQFRANYDTNAVVILGRISAYDNGLSVNCDERHVLEILVNKASALGADLINITAEKQPSVWSTCYRCKAEFIYFADREKAAAFVSDARYEADKIKARVALANAYQSALFWNAVMSGWQGGSSAGIINAGAHR